MSKLALAVLVAGALAPEWSPAQRPPRATETDVTTLRIAVADSASGTAVEGATIELTAPARSSRSNRLGWVRFDSIPVGLRRVHVHAIGFLPIDRLIAVRPQSAADSSAFLIDLVPSAQRLEPVRTVEARTRDADLNGFEARRRLGFGHFVTGDVFEREWIRGGIADIIVAHVPGLRVIWRAGRQEGLVSVRPSTSRTYGLSQFCPLSVVVDGVPQGSGFELTDIMLAEVNGVEVYTPATVPAQFKSPGNAAGRSDCGVLVIWRRTGAR